jgi:CRISPR-associated protein (TIGR03986 family)
MILNIRVNILSPFRVIPWIENKGDARKHDPRYIRGGSFARWHRDKDQTDLGRPYLTGTLLRSALFSEVQELLTRFDPFECCNYMDHTYENIEKPNFIKTSSVYSRKNNLDQPCKTCPLCALMGRADTVRRDHKKDPKNPHNIAHWTVHFANLWESKQQKLCFEQIAHKRMINRVDPYSGKAKDYMPVWEIDPGYCNTFEGKISINLNKISEQDAQKVKTLICVGLSCVNILAGATCRVTVTNANQNEMICQFFKNQVDIPNLSLMPHVETLEPKIIVDLDTVATSIEKILVANQYESHLRRMADTIRDLRRFDHHIIDQLPSKKPEGRKSLWDLSLDSLTIREHLQEAFKNEENIQWRHFCETIGHLLFLKYKKREKENQKEYVRLLGETELLGRPMKEKGPSKLLPKNKEAQANDYLFFAGQLIAKTPFFFGVETKQNQHTSAKILLTPSGKFRLPRSVVRGVMRRDLRQIIGDGCLAEVGGKPCDCKICRFMRCIVVEDAIADCNIPPAIRYRIRLNPHTQTVETGALFDMETGYQGMSFPFRMHLHFQENLPVEILNLLYCWMNETTMFGGDTSVGMGQFQLSENYNAFQFDLAVNDDMALYMMAHGFKGLAKKDMQNILPALNNYTADIKDDFDLYASDFKILIWEQISYQLDIGSPLLSRDTIGALQDTEKDNADAIMIQKLILDQTDNAKNKHVYFIKGESIRGICRSILAKDDPKSENICDLDHEDCNCLQCRLFGNKHLQGKLRFEDAQVQAGSEKQVDHVAIDRFTGGGMDRMKFDEYPIAAHPKATIQLCGNIWIHRHMDDTEKQTLISILENFQQKIPSIGGLSAIGYGQIQSFTLTKKPQWLELTSKDPQTIECKGRVKGSNVQLKLHKDHVYYPHYFIRPPKKEVKRIFANELVSHSRKEDHEKKKLLCGTIHCTLTTRGPVFVADTENDNYFKLQEKHQNHKNLGFFRINNMPVIPGASIRGMVSSVFEALNHTCFRVFDSKKYLSRRINPEKHEKNLPGKVSFKNNQWEVIPMDEKKLPLYDNPSINFDDKTLTTQIKNKYSEDNKLKGTIPKAAQDNRKFLKELDHSVLEKMIKGEAPVYFTNKHSKYACLSHQGRTGYLKISGPNMINVSKTPVTSKKFETAWEKKTIEDIILNDFDNIPLHNDLEIQTNQQKDYIRPVLACVKDSVEYRMHKRFERIFIPKNEPAKPISLKIVKQYNGIVDENKNNTKTIPKIFQSNVSHLSDGDFIYYSEDNDKNIQHIFPVKISREPDNTLMGNRLPEIDTGKPNLSLLPCTFECIEDCENCPDICHPENDYFKPHPKGLCTACHIFGTPFYKSRVRFGMAIPSSPLKWYIGDDSEKGGPLTLPMLERPRPTWSMPKKESPIPGRKFYVHHPLSVEKIKNRQPGSNLDDEIKITANNRTIEPIAKNNTFHFDVKFHNLREWELELLIYALELEDQLAHKLGMGKALGLGSVQISVDALTFHSHDKISFTKKGISNEADTYIQDLKKVLWFDPDNRCHVQYPELKTDDKNIPDYMDLKEKMTVADRCQMLNTPWTGWYKGVC